MDQQCDRAGSGVGRTGYRCVHESGAFAELGLYLLAIPPGAVFAAIVRRFTNGPERCSQRKDLQENK